MPPPPLPQPQQEDGGPSKAMASETSPHRSVLSVSRNNTTGATSKLSEESYSPCMASSLPFFFFPWKGQWDGEPAFDELQVPKGFEWTGAEGKSLLRRGEHPPATRFFPGTVLQRSLFNWPTSQGIGGGRPCARHTQHVLWTNSSVDTTSNHVEW